MVHVLIDGPYGGLCHPETMIEFDEKIVIAGGSGVSFVLPIIEDVLRRANGESAKNRRLHIVLATPNTAVAKWYHSSLQALFARYGIEPTEAGGVFFAIHYSGAASDSNIDLTQVDEKGDPNEKIAIEPVSLSSEKAFRTGRPDLPHFIRNVTAERSGKKVGIIVCGPESMLYDVKNAAANVQGRVGRTGGELWLHAEHFGW
jgi:NAD(P)H-flavin reductase